MSQQRSKRDEQVERWSREIVKRMGGDPGDPYVVRNVVEVVSQANHRGRNEGYHEGHVDGWQDRGSDNRGKAKREQRAAERERMEQ